MCEDFGLRCILEKKMDFSYKFKNNEFKRYVCSNVYN